LVEAVGGSIALDLEYSAGAVRPDLYKHRYIPGAAPHTR
jgi:hypothetical protein